MRYLPIDYEIVDRMALQVRIDYGFLAYEVDVFELAKRIGIILIPYSQLTDEQKHYIMKNKKLKDGFSIAVEKDGILQWHTFYNDKMSLSRQRFTIAHEIKHVIFGETDPDEKEEALADHFARHLLAPTCLVMKFLNDPLGPLTVLSVFNISFEAAENAYYSATNRCEGNFKGFSKIEKEFLNLIRTK